MTHPDPLAERIARILTSTTRTDWKEYPLRTVHGAGHIYDIRCALCAGDTDALTAALLPVLGAPVVRDGLRDRIAEALLDYLSRTADIRTGRTGDLAFMPEITDAEQLRIADAVLAVLPPTNQRADVLLWAADRYETILASATAQHSSDPRYYTGVRDVILGLRRLAGEAQQDEARPPQHAWRVETRDPLADEWAPGSHFASRPHAVERYETANRIAPVWRDGTPVERRIVRETTTYTVEEPNPGQPDTGETAS
jgi:hypothetical protein